MTKTDFEAILYAENVYDIVYWERIGFGVINYYIVQDGEQIDLGTNQSNIDNVTNDIANYVYADIIQAARAE